MMTAQAIGLDQILVRAATAERAGDLPAMRALGQRAVTAFPDHPGAWFILGLAQHRLGDGASSLVSLRTARRLGPENPTILHMLGLVAFAHRQASLAVDAFETLVAAPGDLPPSQITETLILLADLLCDLARPIESERHARRALALDPENRDARRALGASLLAQNRVLEMRALIGGDPDDVGGLLLLAAAFESDRQPEVAQQLYARVLQIEPENPRALMRQLDVSLTLCEWRNYENLVRGVLDRVRADIAAGEGLTFDVFNLLALPVDPPLILAASRAQAAKHARGVLASPARGTPVRTPGRRIRLAYLLPYTDRHSLPQALIGVIGRHDRSRFEVLGYSLRACNSSAFSVEFRATFDDMRDLAPGQATHSAEIVRADDIDILVDTTGHTGLNGLSILAHRPAAVQAHYLGYGLTSGADFIDYLITDRNFLGPGGEHHIAEAPVFLPHSFMATMRAPIAVDAPTRRDEGLPETGIVFANFNHPCKIDPTTFALWMDLLRQVPGSVLWMGGWTSSARRHLRGVAAERGVSPKRLVFAELAPHPVHLGRLALADIGLDNRLHGGGVTTVDALWVGLPVVSLAGASPAARLGATLLPAAGVPELVVGTVDDYVALALALARDPDRRAALRARLIAGRDNAPLFDIDRQTRYLETAYEMMWRDHRAGRSPAMIEVPGNLA